MMAVIDQKVKIVREEIAAESRYRIENVKVIEQNLEVRFMIINLIRLTFRSYKKQ